MEVLIKPGTNNPNDTESPFQAALGQPEAAMPHSPYQRICLTRPGLFLARPDRKPEFEDSISPGLYVVAVSGGVDSMALLDLLRRHPNTRLVVAHFDHGVRPDSALDRKLVQDTARRHGLQFVYDQANLGLGVSEDTARQARYKFLHRVREASAAQAVITAHHQDDLLETAVHNMLRGTGRRGLVSLRSHDILWRPLLGVSKKDLVAYAKDQGLVWREDSTNQDMRYMRNYIRHKLLPRLNDDQRQELLGHIRATHDLHAQLETELTNHLHLHPAVDKLDRHWFIMLPHVVAREVLLVWLRKHGVADVSARMLERLVVAAKTYSPGRIADVDKTYILQIGKNILALVPRDR